MIKVTLIIDNKTAHSCSPVEFLRKFVLLEAENRKVLCGIELGGKFAYHFDTPYANIEVQKIEQF
jgi:hypothetical protein